MHQRDTLARRVTHADKEHIHHRLLNLGHSHRQAVLLIYFWTALLCTTSLALKFMAEEVSARPELREMFEREAKAAAALNHPGIVTIYDYGVIEGRAFITWSW